MDGVALGYSLVLMTFLTVWLQARLSWCLWFAKACILLAQAVFGVQSMLIYDFSLLVNIVILYMYLNIQSLLYDVEDSREKLDRFFSYNFLFFDDD